MLPDVQWGRLLTNPRNWKITEAEMHLIHLASHGPGCLPRAGPNRALASRCEPPSPRRACNEALKAWPPVGHCTEGERSAA